MSTEKMRAEFESRVSDRAWFVPRGRVDASLPEGFEYEDFTTDMCWTCWVESRAAIEVELPLVLMPVEVDHHSDLPLMQAGAVVAAIESLGLKAKP